MLLTEKEAQSKWCPMYRLERKRELVDVLDSVAVNTFNDKDGITQYLACVGSRCAMWRWSGSSSWLPLRWPATDTLAIDEPPRPAKVPASWEWVPHSAERRVLAKWVEPESEWLARRKGYCGLAGNPNT